MRHTITLFVCALAGTASAQSSDDTAERVLHEIFRAIEPPVPLKLDANGIPEGWIVIDDMMFPPDSDPTEAGGFRTNFWTGGDVFYYFDANVSPSQAAAMESAMSDWEQAVETLDFKLWAGEPNRIRVRDSSGDENPGNNSAVGMVGGEQIININAWSSPRVIRHELGHALGFWHEQQRPDRFQYIDIEWENIREGFEHNFDVPDSIETYGPYDFESIMHYRQCSFSVCSDCGADPENCRTITVLPPNEVYQDQIGTFSEFSRMDVMTMSFMYPRSDWSFVDLSFTGIPLGTFLQPWTSLQFAYLVAPPETVIHLQPGEYIAAGVYAKAMTLRAPIGGVAIR